MGDSAPQPQLFQLSMLAVQAKHDIINMFAVIAGQERFCGSFCLGLGSLSIFFAKL